MVDMKNWKNYLAWLISPMAIGIYITLITIRLTILFYDARTVHSGGANQSLTNLLMIAHQKSIDFRLRARGPRAVSKNVALLTVDERAVEALGRWPWPRALIAKGVENAFANGAKLLAFDMTFSEASNNPATEVFKSAEDSGELTPEKAQWLKAISPRLDNDDALGKAYTKYADRIVAGAFNTQNLEGHWPPETDFCRDMIFKRTAQAKQWDKEEVLLSVNDPTQPSMPKTLEEVFAGALQNYEQAEREKMGPPKSKSEAVLLEDGLQDKLYGFCDGILDAFREELNQNWAQVVSQENSKTFNYPSYDAWAAEYKKQSFPNSVSFADHWNLNTPAVSVGTKHTGYFNTQLDADGTIRRTRIVQRTGNHYFPSLSLKAFLVANNYNASPRLEYNPASGFKEVVQMEVTDNDTGNHVLDIPVDGSGDMLINYAGPEKMYPYLSFADLLSDSPDAIVEQRIYDPSRRHWEIKSFKVKKAEFMKDKIFVVGASAIGIFDLRVTPFEENYPGAETHLNALDNMLSRGFFRTIPDEAVYMPLVLLGLGVSLSVALSYLGALWGLGLTATFLLGTILIDKHYLFSRGIVVSIIWPIFLIAFLYVALTFYRYFTEERGKKELRQTFQKYVSPAIVEEILAHPKNIELGGKKTNLTVMFSDVRGFTTISEKLDPRALSDLLNSYLTPMTELVFKNQGTLDKYMGDAIMAFFGAPIQYKDHAKYACRCALQSLSKLFELQKEYERKGLPSIDIGIGLNTGDVSVGNMGSETVRSYTVMGDAVNLASRLEGINKQYGTRIILSEMTYQEIKDNFVCREVDWVRVKGKALPVKIYELISEERAPSAATAELLKWFREGYDFYHAKAWQKGAEAFSKALNLNPTDPVSKLYIERCQDYLIHPPDEGWDGVFVMKTK